MFFRDTIQYRLMNALFSRGAVQKARNSPSVLPHNLFYLESNLF